MTLSDKTTKQITSNLEPEKREHLFSQLFRFMHLIQNNSSTIFDFIV